MNSLNVISIVILATGFVSLTAGLLLFWSVRKSGKEVSPRTTNVIAWLLIALFPVLLLFSFFPSATFTGTILGFSATGATALFVFIWWYGAKRAIEAIEADQASARIEAGLIDQKQRVDDLNNQLRALQNDLEHAQLLAAAREATKVLTETKVFRCALRSTPTRVIGLITGNLEGVRVADIWVNSENNNMQMSRWYEGTISGMIRYLGARKDEGGEIIEDGDIIARELKEKMGKRTRVEPTTVFVTSPGELARRPYNVKALIHIATVQGAPGKGYRAIENLEDCVSKVLQQAESDNSLLEGCKSIVFPLLGSGHGQADIGAVADKLLTRAINELASNPNGRIECIYFLVWTNLHFETCRDILCKNDRIDSRELDSDRKAASR